LRAGSAASGTGSAASVEPVTCAESGTPYISGFRVQLAGQETWAQFNTTFLHDSVVRDASTLVQQGVLQPGAQFTYRLCAFTDPMKVAEPDSQDFDLEAAPVDLRIGSANMPVDTTHCGTPSGTGELPVVFVRSVLDEALRLARAARDLETGGVLLGGLRRDPSTRALFVEVTALITAPGSTGTATSLHFGPDTFVAVEEILKLRDLEEIMVGWWHSHPLFCARCPAAQRAVCEFRKPFFSEADRDVHRTLFPQAFSLALLISDLGELKQSADLFAWREGLITQRGFMTSPDPAVLSKPTHTKEPFSQ
ncbi:MAG: hypothetical protein O3A63_15845, partial [Proteobacteria bacterium]|nr:hypothetical protein [Pseudomonadota bacterium]